MLTWDKIDYVKMLCNCCEIATGWIAKWVLIYLEGTTKESMKHSSASRFSILGERLIINMLFLLCSLPTPLLMIPRFFRLTMLNGNEHERKNSIEISFGDTFIICFFCHSQGFAHVCIVLIRQTTWKVGIYGKINQVFKETSPSKRNWTKT